MLPCHQPGRRANLHPVGRGQHRQRVPGHDVGVPLPPRSRPFSCKAGVPRAASSSSSFLPSSTPAINFHASSLAQSTSAPSTAGVPISVFCAFLLGRSDDLVCGATNNDAAHRGHVLISRALGHFSAHVGADVNVSALHRRRTGSQQQSQQHAAITSAPPVGPAGGPSSSSSSSSSGSALATATTGSPSTGNSAQAPADASRMCEWLLLLVSLMSACA